MCKEILNRTHQAKIYLVYREILKEERKKTLF